MTFEVRNVYINLQWTPVLVVTTETEQEFFGVSFTETKESGGMFYVTTYIVRPAIWRHYPPGYDASNPDTHKYMFILVERRTEVVTNQAAAANAAQLEEYAQALNILGVETEEVATDEG